MTLLVVGINHRTADFATLERVAVPSPSTDKALRAVTALDHIQDAVVLSTCNRVEIYAETSRFHPGLRQLLEWLSGWGDIAPRELETIHYAYHDDRAAAHLFAVASGVDSMVVGERQITLQVKEAAAAARRRGGASQLLHRLFDQALYTARRVRAETDISKGASSLVEVGMDVATSGFDGGLTGRTALIVGAGKLGGLTADWLADTDPDRVLVHNRTPDKAERLAGRIGAGAVTTGGLVDALTVADLVICCTGAAAPVIDAPTVTAAVADRQGRGLVLLDLGMPRNVEAACGELDDVDLVDLERVREVTDSTVTGTTIEAARRIVEEEASRFRDWTRAVQVDPTIKALRERAEAVRRDELERLSSKLSELDDREHQAVEALTSGIINTLLHEPTVRLKRFASGGGAEEYVLALRDLFGLDDED